MERTLPSCLGTETQDKEYKRRNRERRSIRTAALSLLEIDEIDIKHTPFFRVVGWPINTGNGFYRYNVFFFECLLTPHVLSKTPLRE